MTPSLDPEIGSLPAHYHGNAAETVYRVCSCNCFHGYVWCWKTGARCGLLCCSLKLEKLDMTVTMCIQQALCHLRHLAVLQYMMPLVCTYELVYAWCG